MKKSEIAKGLAEQAGLTEAEAADRLDGVVHEILSKLRKGEPAPLPGMGRFVKGRDGVVTFRPRRGKRHD
jgi:nucleoid DNA-binding protein